MGERFDETWPISTTESRLIELTMTCADLTSCLISKDGMRELNRSQTCSLTVLSARD
jgi:hypothetical protein